jgi:hypothetical protein
MMLLMDHLMLERFGDSQSNRLAWSNEHELDILVGREFTLAVPCFC